MERKAGDSMPDQASSAQPRVVVRNLTKVFETKRGRHVALDNVSLEVGAGESLVLLGPSGCGKTTLLRCVAGLERPDSGEILVHGKVVFSSEKGIYRPPEARRLSMVFQSYALWPHMTVAENVEYPLRNLKTPANEIGKRVAHVLDMVGLGSYASSYPGQMSGGQQQRVALARAIVSSEGIVLFDEPLSNLDAKVREKLRVELLTMQRDIGFSSLYVTHDQAEAMALADRIAVMGVGRIAQLGRGDDIYRRPVSRYVANFVGKSNEIAGTVRDLDGEYAIVDTPLGTLRGRTEGASLQAGQKVFVLFRPEAAAFGDGVNAFAATLKHSTFLGAHLEWIVVAGHEPLVVTLPDRPVPPVGTELTLSLDPERVRIFADEGSPA